MDNYPALTSSQLENAPWNEKYQKPHTITVTVSVTLSKEVKVEVDDYDMIEDRDEFGYFKVPDYSNCDLEGAVNDQIDLPQNDPKFKDWTVDDFEVILDD